MCLVVHREPFLLGSGELEAARVAAQVQAEPSPVARGQQWHADLRQVTDACTVVVVDQGMAPVDGNQVHPVLGESLRTEGLVAADELAGAGVAPAPLAQAVLRAAG